MRVLVLGGTGFVGRAVASAAVARGHEVTVLNRGRRELPAGVRLLVAERPGAVPAGEWDVAVDTWSADAGAVRTAAGSLRGRCGLLQYVSSRSVYAAGTGAGADEDAPTVGADEPGYAGDKRRGELATAAFDGPVLLARAGLILGPYEDVGRLPWWLLRLARGGRVPAPGPADLGVQFVDARDLAAFLLDAAGARLTGAYNLVCPVGHTTTGALLDAAVAVTGGRAELCWRSPAQVAAAGVGPWVELPLWLPPGEDHAFMHQAGVARALAAGLRCRPAAETVADTWAWVRSVGVPPQRPDLPVVGLDAAAEARLLAQ